MNAKKATTNVCCSRIFGMIVGWVVMLASVQAYALTLGNFQVTSALDEPLRAEITLQSVDAETLETLEINLGTPEDFRRADVPRSEFLQQLQFTVNRDGDDAVVVVSTDQPVKEPFLHFLISAEWAGGKLVREYTGLLDPPLYAEQSPSTVQAPSVAQSQPEESLPTMDSGAAASDTTGSAPSVTTVTGSTGRSAEYGPTQEGDTLWSIASRLDTGSIQANVFQIMMALQRENPDAFIDNNVNRLKTGQILHLENLASVADVSAEEASVSYTAQLEEWQSSQSRVADAGGETGTATEATDEMASTDTAAAESDDSAEAEAATSTSDEAAADTAAATEAAGEGDDVLRIVQATVDGAEESESASAGSDRSGEMAELQGRIATLEETLESRNLENEELQERVRLLESQLENAQRLIEIESQELAAAQQQAAQQQAAEEAREAEARAESEAEAEAEAQAEAQAEADAQASAQQMNTVEPVQEDSGQPEQESSSQGSMTQGGETSGESQEIQQEMQQEMQESQAGSQTGSQATQAAAATATSQASQSSAQNTQSNSQNVRKVAGRPPQGGGAWWSQIPDMLFSSWMWMVGAGVGVLVLVLGLLMFLRRRQSIAEFEESILSGSALDSYSDTTDTAGTSASDTSFLSDFGTAGMGTMQADEVDPLAEAEVYLAYGRDEQAEDVLKEAARRDPERSEIKLKLLEIYKQRNDIKSFETIAEELYPAGDQGDITVWRQVTAMGRELSPNNPLFQDEGETGESPAGAGVADAEDLEPAPAATAPAGAGSGGMDFDLDDLEPEREDAPEPATAAPMDTGDEPAAPTLRREPAKMADDSLEFNDDFMERSTRSVDPSTQPFPAPDQQTDLDREFDRLASERETAQAGVDEAPARDLTWDRADTEDSTLDFAARDTSEIEFDLNLDDSSIQRLSGSDNGGGEQPGAGGRQSGAESEGVLEFESENIPPEETWAGPSSDATPGGDEEVDYSPVDNVASSGAPAYDEAETKLDLARAYLDMGDKVGARSIIDEVMREGDPAQRDQAAELASQL